MKIFIVALTLMGILFSSYQYSYSQTAKEYYESGYKKCENEKYIEAIPDLKKALETNNKKDKSYNTVLKGSTNALGLCYYELHKYETALKYYDEVILLDSTYAGFYFNRALVYGEMENNIGAIDDYTKAIKLNPDYAFAYANRGVIYLNIGYREEACEDFKKALDLGDNEIKSYYQKYCK